MEEGFVYIRALREASLFAVTNCSPGGPCGARKRSSFSFLAENVRRRSWRNWKGPVFFLESIFYHDP